MAKRYTVIAPLAVIRDTAGADQYVYQGREVTFNVAPERLAQLVDKKVIAEVSGDGDAAAEAETFDGPPAKSATKDVWVAYAVSQGFDEDQAKALKKPELIDAVLDEGDTDESDTDSDES